MPCRGATAPTRPRAARHRRRPVAQRRAGRRDGPGAAEGLRLAGPDRRARPIRRPATSRAASATCCGRPTSTTSTRGAASLPTAAPGRSPSGALQVSRRRRRAATRSACTTSTSYAAELLRGAGDRSTPSSRPAGWKANAYIIFDYYSPTDFKFAGIDVSTNKMVIGHRAASGWVVDKQLATCSSKPDTFYNMLVAVNGTNVTVSRRQQARPSRHTFAPRMIDGVPYGLN